MADPEKTHIPFGFENDHLNERGEYRRPEYGLRFAMLDEEKRRDRVYQHEHRQPDEPRYG